MITFGTIHHFLPEGGADGVWLGLVSAEEEEEKAAEWPSLGGRSWKWSDDSPLSYTNWETPNLPRE